MSMNELCERNRREHVHYVQASTARKRELGKRKREKRDGKAPTVLAPTVEMYIEYVMNIEIHMIYKPIP